MDLLDSKYHKFDRYVNSWHIVIPRKRFGILRDSANVSGYRGCQFIIRIIGRNRAALFAGRVMRDWLGCVSIIDASARLLEWQNRRSVYGHPRVFRLAFEHASISLQIVLYNIACTRAKSPFNSADLGGGIGYRSSIEIIQNSWRLLSLFPPRFLANCIDDSNTTTSIPIFTRLCL